MTVIKFNNVTKSYRTHSVLDHMDFTIEEGVLTGVIGRNGVGKSTLMKISAGYIQATSGEVQVFSENPFNSLKVSANSILVDDTMSFSDKLSLSDILKEANRFYLNWDAQLAQRLFDYFSFHPDVRHKHLSKGKKSTFNAIIGIASHCPLTIFDEPTTGMDTAVRKDFYRALLKDYIANPRTILLSSHHLEEIEDLLEDILLIHDGKIRFHGPITDLQEMLVKLVGKKVNVLAHTSKRTIFGSQVNGAYSEVLVENKFTADEKIRLSEEGIKMIPVSANDAYVALTTGAKGGIDDVFNRTATD
ncbi:ATP-binding cassette domain-containing protein [Sporosarcina limicola]|uniref:ABC-2 type transport system ATP-binding protein n=1 Tax=Sporosarcina limicola TaxID=34101 RepID=A0A927MMD6_9BACL|nr:ABC transporter ATP-binding protein [Sporosarcina limicola]MBE1555772.1 ABC-2 type transport system ATP-binding protein [Sporosarcina limicola]